MARKINYPYRARHDYHKKLIVEFTSDGTGTVISSNHPEYPVDYYSETWAQGCFRKMKS